MSDRRLSELERAYVEASDAAQAAVDALPVGCSIDYLPDWKPIHARMRAEDELLTYVHHLGMDEDRYWADLVARRWPSDADV